MSIGSCLLTNWLVGVVAWEGGCFHSGYGQWCHRYSRRYHKTPPAALATSGPGLWRNVEGWCQELVVNIDSGFAYFFFFFCSHYPCRAFAEVTEVVVKLFNTWSIDAGRLKVNEKELKIKTTCMRGQGEGRPTSDVIYSSPVVL